MGPLTLLNSAAAAHTIAHIMKTSLLAFFLASSVLPVVQAQDVGSVIGKARDISVPAPVSSAVEKPENDGQPSRFAKIAAGPVVRTLPNGDIELASPPPQRPDVPVLPDDTTPEKSDKISRAPDTSAFIEPAYTEKEEAEILSGYTRLDPKHLVPDNLLYDAVLYYHANLENIANKTWLSVVDFSKHSSKARFFLIEMKTGKVQAFHVAHGIGSDPNNTGYPISFSNVSGSKKSSLGAYLTAETYDGCCGHGRALRIDGLSSTNSNVRSRAIVVHGAKYVKEANVQPGRSEGCLALSMNIKDAVIAQVKEGSIIYAGLGGKAAE